MKLTTGLTLLSAAIASSRTVVVRDSSDDVQDMSIADYLGDPIPGENPFTFCKGDRSQDAVCIELHLSQSPILHPSNLWRPPQKSAL